MSERGSTKASRIEQLCCARHQSVSQSYAEHPDKSPGDLALELYQSHHLTTPKTKLPERRTVSQEDLQWAKRCGNFGDSNPSDLFLHAYHDLLQPLEQDVLCNCVSPSLIGSTGFVPMTIIAPLNDQLRHMSNLIVRAKREVLLATNFWKSSGASHFINDALIELSKRAAQGWQSAGVDLPPPAQIPNIDFAIVNFHRPMLGTFHCKFMICDRSVATVSSNNIQDNDNLEMMSHLEGPIVDSLWDTFVISWHNKLDPFLPCRDSPAAQKPPPTYQEPTFTELFDESGAFRKPEEPIEDDLREHMPGEPHYDSTIADEIQRLRSVLRPLPQESHADAVARHLNKPTGLTISATAPAREPNLHFFPFIPVPPTPAVPMAMASRKPYGSMNNESAFVPQNEAFLSLIRNAQRSVFIQTPDLNAKDLLPAIIAACKRGIQVTYYVCLGYNDTGEMLPGQNGTNEMAANSLFAQLSASEQQNLLVHFYVAADQDHPIHNEFKQRSCHIKLMIVDESVAIQGSGNQDTQSWYHSQEVNVMIDSPVVCGAWREAIERNQNTARFGRARNDGCWYDDEGKLAKGSYGTSAGSFAWATGLVGAVKKAQGK
nr:hypothetical protein CFP56_52141 [Quercus suber]